MDVLGTVHRPEKYKKDTYITYVVEIELEKYFQRIFVRHAYLEEIEKLAEKLKIELTKQYKPHFNLSPSKLVEARKMII